MYDKTDEELVTDVQNGGISSYEQLVKRYQQRLFSYVSRFLKREDDAKDAVQNAFIHAYEHIDRFDVGRMFSAYIYTIVKNEALSVLRTKKRFVSLHQTEIVDDSLGLEDALYDKQKREDVRRVIAGLKEVYRNVIRLYYFDGLSYEEIGMKLRLPKNTVRTDIRRAKMLIKEQLSYETH